MGYNYYMATTIGLCASLIGFCIAVYIYNKQHAKKPLLCPRNAPCETVLNSPQATTLGFSNAALGIVYYAVAFFLFFCLYVGGHSSIVEVVLALMSVGGFGFSIYLVRVQKLVIKQWCVWCLASAATATIVFLATWLFIFTG